MNKYGNKICRTRRLAFGQFCLICANLYTVCVCVCTVFYTLFQKSQMWYLLFLLIFFVFQLELISLYPSYMYWSFLRLQEKVFLLQYKVLGDFHCKIYWIRTQDRCQGSRLRYHLATTNKFWLLTIKVARLSWYFVFQMWQCCSPWLSSVCFRCESVDLPDCLLCVSDVIMLLSLTVFCIFQMWQCCSPWLS